MELRSTSRPRRVPLVLIDICITGCRAVRSERQRGHCPLSPADCENTSKACPHSAHRKSKILKLMIGSRRSECLSLVAEWSVRRRLRCDR